MASSTSIAGLPSEVLETILAYLGRLQGSGAPRPAERLTHDLASLRLSCRYLRQAANESLRSLDIQAAKLCGGTLHGGAVACFDRFPAVQELRVDIEGARVLRLAPLVAQVPGLQSLTAYDGSDEACSTLSKLPVTLSPLTGLQALMALQLDRCTLNVEVLGSMAQLTRLALVNCTITGSVTSLVHIRQPNVNKSLKADQARQLGSLSLLTHLQVATKRVSRYTTQLPDLSGLTGLCHLAITGSATFATSLRSLTGLTHLTTQFVDEPAALGCLAMLRQLSTECNLSKLPLAALSGLVDLTIYDIRANVLSAFSGVSSQLTRLIVRDWRVADFASLVSLPRLRVLELEAGSSHAPTSMGQISSLTELQRLRLICFHALANVDSLASLQQLRELDLSYCLALANISPVSRLNLLTSLVVKELGIHDTLAIQALTKLQDLTLAECDKLTYGVWCLTSLCNLTSLTVSFSPQLVAVEGTDPWTVQAPAQLHSHIDFDGHHWWQPD